MRSAAAPGAPDTASGGCGGACHRWSSVACSGRCCRRGTSSRAAAVSSGLPSAAAAPLPAALAPLPSAAASSGSAEAEGGQGVQCAVCSVTRALSSSQAPSRALRSTASHQ